ncbi:MAG: ATP-dependent RNA helicase [Nannocystaceae bacterium]|nr:ATP-dependent RNA helicase [Nannocystaceae bacterium]
MTARSQPSAAPRLPIDDARDAFTAALGQGRPIVVSAPTGSGKSTRLPSWLVDAGLSRVLVVEPRRLAARALAGWVAQSRGDKLGEAVGYQVRFEGRHSPDTKILFVTPGVALAMLAEGDMSRVAPGLDRFDAILVDEFHERAWEVDLVVALVRHARATRDKYPQLTVCSATLAEAELAMTLDAAVVRSEGRAFPVDIEYEGEGWPSSRDIEGRMATAVARALTERDGDVLAFLPGKGEIERTVRALQAVEVDVVAVHGGIQPSRLAAALAPARSRRVFVSTNVAETSLTFPGVRTVIDSGLARMRVHQAGHSVLALVPISAASADQRAGRAGRVSAGTCVRLWSRQTTLEPNTPPELTRIELDDVLLRAAAAGLSAHALAQAPWVTPPPEFALQAARKRLTAAGDLDAHGVASPRGYTRARLPVSAWASRILSDPPEALAPVLADIVAIADLRRDLVLPGECHDAVHRARHGLFGGARDEVEVQLRALWDGDAARHGLHTGALREARAVANQLRQRVGAPRRAPGTSRDWDHAAVVSHLLSRVPESAFVPRKKGRGSARGSTSRGAAAWGNGEHEVLLRPTWVPGLDADAQPASPTAAIVLDLEWLSVGRGAQGRGRLALACRLKDLLKAGIGEATIGPAILVRQRGRKVVMADIQITHAGTTLQDERGPLTGAALITGIAQLMLGGRWRHLEAAAILDALHVDALLRQLAPKPDDEPCGDPVAVVTGRLVRLGVTSAEDVELLAASDLAPDADTTALERGIDAREPASLLRDFPRLWSFEGTRFACGVDFSRRCVVIEPVRSVGKGREPPRAVLPRFRGFSVEYRKASRRVRLR